MDSSELFLPVIETMRAQDLEHADLRQDAVRKVLELELHSMFAIGAAKRAGYQLRYYVDVQLGPPEVVDAERLARDAERMLGITYGVPDRILEFELRFLEMRGFAVAGARRDPGTSPD